MTNDTDQIDDSTGASSNPDRFTDKTIVSGWQRRYYEDFTVGDIYEHSYRRTVTETDNVWFTNLTMNLNPMHFNEAYAAETSSANASLAAPT